MSIKAIKRRITVSKNRFAQSKEAKRNVFKVYDLETRAKDAVCSSYCSRYL